MYVHISTVRATVKTLVMFQVVTVIEIEYCIMAIEVYPVCGQFTSVTNNDLNGI